MVYPNVKVDTTEDKVRFTILVLAAIKVFIGTLGFNLFNEEQWVAFENLLPFGFIIYGMWKNNYVSEKGEKQKALLKRNGLSD